MKLSFQLKGYRNSFQTERSEMNIGIKRLKFGVELGVFALMAGTLIAGCGGGGAPSSGSTAVASYIADDMSGSFSGNWWVGNWLGSSPVASATVLTETLAATSQPTTFNVTENYQALVNGTWSSLAVSSGGAYNLTPNGWAFSTNGMLGNLSWTAVMAPMLLWCLPTVPHTTTPSPGVTWPGRLWSALAPALRLASTLPELRATAWPIPRIFISCITCPTACR
jgi:hypothetical protein